MADERLEEPAEGPERLLPCPPRCGSADRGGDAGRNRVAIAVLVEDRGDRLGRLAAGSFSYDLPERLVGRALAGRSAAADEHGRSTCQGRDELVREPGLADAGIPDERHEPECAPGLGMVEGGSKPSEGSRPADQPRVEAVRERGRIGKHGCESQRFVVGLKLREHRMTDEARVRRSEQDGARLGGGAQPEGSTHDVSADRRAVGDHLSGLDADAEPVDVLQLGRSLDRAERVVFVERRDPEDAHDALVGGALGDRTVPDEHGGDGVLGADHDATPGFGFEPDELGSVGARRVSR